MNQMFEAEALEFPAFADLPKREKSKVAHVWDTFRELSRVTEEKGMLVPQTFVAKLLGISTQRVHQLVAEGRFETYEMNGIPLITENSIVAFAKLERKSGRPLKVIRPTLADGMELAQGYVRKK